MNDSIDPAIVPEPIVPEPVSLSRAELERLLSAAARRGARQALEDLGLENGAAREDIRELRSLLQALRLARRTAWQTAIRVLTTVFLAALLAWAGVKLRLIGD